VEQRALRWTKAPLKPNPVRAIRIHLQREQWVRDLAMFDLAIDSKLRGCDLVKLKIANYTERRASLRVGTSITEGTANFLVNRRMNKSQ
jgi:hypothetical protein